MNGKIITRSDERTDSALIEPLKIGLTKRMTQYIGMIFEFSIH